MLLKSKISDNSNSINYKIILEHNKNLRLFVNWDILIKIG